jgi:serine/threonine protein kinase
LLKRGGKNMFIVTGYEMLETIYEGYKKVIYRCKDTTSQKNVILKILKGELADYEDVIRFKREYKILSDLCDKIEGIAKPQKVFEYNGSFIIVLEDEAGDTLKKIISTEKQDIGTLLNLAVNIIDILGKIHENNIIHKDLKPSNIIWNKEKNLVKIIDFDLAAELKSEKHHFQNTGILEGTLQYISPEQTGRINRNIDYRTDFYSFGVILYEMFTGKEPYKADTVVDYVYSIIAKNVIPPYEVTNGIVSKELSDIIMKLLAKSPENRYRSAYGIKADLKKCIKNEGYFEIGNEDKLNIFHISQKNYGREKELMKLKEIFFKSIKDNPQVLFISGESGTGKTSFVNELH